LQQCLSAGLARSSFEGEQRPEYLDLRLLEAEGALPQLNPGGQAGTQGIRRIANNGIWEDGKGDAARFGAV